MDEIETQVEISVSPEDDVELRRVSITNRGRSRAHHRVDELRRSGAAPPPPTPRIRRSATCSCRPRWFAARGDPLHAAAPLGRRAAAVDDPPDDRPRHVGRRDLVRDRREAFIGRGRSRGRPRGNAPRPRLTDSEGAVLDPDRRHPQHGRPRARRDGARPPGDRRRRDARAALAWSRSISDRHLADRVFDLAWTHSQVVLRRLDATEADTQLYGRLAEQHPVRQPGPARARRA